MKKLLRKRKGEAGFESVLLFPLILLMLMICLYFLFICLSYVQINNTANTLAQSLNMRQSGYRDARLNSQMTGIIEDSWNNANIIGSGSEDTLERTFRFINGSADNPGEIVDVVIGGSNEDIKKAMYFAVEENINKLLAPGCSITSIYAEASKNGTELTGGFQNKDISMSNTVVRVHIKYKCFGIPLTADGYNIIT